MCRNKHTSYTQSPIFGHFPRGKNRSFFRALEAVDFALGRRGDFEAGKNRRGLFPAEVLASVFGDSALSALFRRDSRGEVFAAVFKFLLGWAEFYRDSDRLIGLPGGLPVRTPFPRETYGYPFPFSLVPFSFEGGRYAIKGFCRQKVWALLSKYKLNRINW